MFCNRKPRTRPSRGRNLSSFEESPRFPTSSPSPRWTASSAVPSKLLVVSTDDRRAEKHPSFPTAGRFVPALEHSQSTHVSRSHDSVTADSRLKPAGQDNRRKRLGVRLPPSAFALRPGAAAPRPRPPDVDEPTPTLADDDLALEPLVLWDEPGPDGPVADAGPEAPAAAGGGGGGEHAFVSRASRALGEYRAAKGLPAAAVVVEPFLCRCAILSCYC